MAEALSLIVGLGNTGDRYEATRHNVGFWFVDRFASARGVEFRPQPRFAGDVARFRYDDEDRWLLKPATLMNRSGVSVAPFARYYRIPTSAILVVHDDLDLPPGTVRLKTAGGHGGHNGLRDIISHMGSSDFVRLRIGIGQAEPGGDASDYVLSRPPGDERELIESSIEHALSYADAIVSGQHERVMNVLHRRATPPAAGDDTTGG